MQAVSAGLKKISELGKEMVSGGLITKEQLAVAEVTQKTLGGDLTHILIKKGFSKEQDILNFFSKNMGLPIVEGLDQIPIERTLLRFIPYHFAKKYTVIPIRQTGMALTLAIADPNNCSLIEDQIQCEGLSLDFNIASRLQIETAIRNVYQVHKISSRGSEQVEIVTEEKKFQSDSKDNKENVEEMAASVGTVTAVNSILETAYSAQASDIHIEPQEKFVRVRLRIDGLLEEKHILPSQMQLPIVSRIKIISGMNIAERRAPQDGRFTVRIHGNVLDCRTSCYPTIYGEKVVIRLLSKGSLKKLEHLGMFPKDGETFRSWILRPHGLIFVTGPTGSGKSTSLYAALQLLNSIDRNIVSIEDPVENEVPGVNQAQVNNKANVSFASALRSMLRQDPDVIMVGEVRDGETAEMALRAALTGHLVLSTLHTNTSIGAVSRLINLGIPSYLLSSALIGVLGQRLVRRICQHCKEEYVAEEQDRIAIGLPEGTKVFRGKGCEKCRNTGYSSRIGLFELFSVTQNLRQLVEKGDPEEVLTTQANKDGFKAMIEDGREKVLKGLTTIREVIKVTEAV